MVTANPAPVELPERVPNALKDALKGTTLIAWSEYDLDTKRTYSSAFVALTDNTLYIHEADKLQKVLLKNIRNVDVKSFRGFEQLKIEHGVSVSELSFLYTLRHRSPMQVLIRNLKTRTKEQKSDSDLTVHEALDVEVRCKRCGQVIPPKNEGACPKCTTKSRQILRRLLPFARPYRFKLWIVLALTLLSSALATLPPYCYLHLIDDGIRGKDIFAFWLWSGIAAVTMLSREAVGSFRGWLLDYIGVRFAQDLRYSVFEHLQTLSLRYFQRRRTGTLISRVTGDTERIWEFIVLYYVNLIRDSAMILFVAVVMFSINWQLAIAALFPLPILAGLTFWRGRTLQGLFNASWHFRVRLLAIAGDSIPGIRVVKAFGGEPKETRRFGEASQELTDHQKELNRKWALTQPLFSTLMGFSGLGIWVLGGSAIILSPPESTNQLTLGILTAFTTYLSQFYSPVIALTRSHQTVARTSTSAHRILDVIDSVPEITSKPDAVRVSRVKGDFELQNVSFSYESHQATIKDMSLKVSSGEMIGICGPSGSGKTTLLHLICRFYDPQSGRILLDGKDLRDYRVDDLRKNIGVVLQDPFLFHGTLTENIRYGAPHATMNDIIEAARAAEAHEFIMKLPNGYDSTIGERGLTLSGGERQRISIARALIKDPAILILDEATSSLDIETEGRIRTALDRLVKGRTTFAIAHRLSTLRSADRLLVLDSGKIAEVGSHAELLAQPDGTYAKMHETQKKMSELIAVAG